MPTNPDELFQEAACFNCNSNASLADLLKLALLDRISESAGGGGGTPSAPLNSVQFNNAGAFGGSADFTFDDATNVINFADGSTIQFAGGGSGSLSGAAGNTFLAAGAGGFLQLRNGVTNIAFFDPSGDFGFNVDNTLDIGFVGVNRPRFGYFGTRVDAPTLRTDQAFTVGGGTGLPAAGVPGRRAYVTDALGPAFGAVVVGGGAVVVPVFDDGTNWIVG